jgi:hypothetical protein
VAAAAQTMNRSKIRDRTTSALTNHRPMTEGVQVLRVDLALCHRPFFQRPLPCDEHARCYVEINYAERHVLPPYQRQQALSDTSLDPADEELRRQPPRTEIVGNAAPFGTILVPPEDGGDGSLEVLRRRLRDS